MHKVTIKKSGLYFLFWDQSKEDWIEKNIVEAAMPISWYLSYPVQFNEMLTIREVIKLLKPYADDLNLIMAHDLAGIEMERIFELSESTKEPAKIEPDSIYLVRIAEATPMVQDEEEFNFLSTYPILVGLKEIEDAEEDEVFSLSSIDFLDWCDLPFELDDYVEYINPTTEDVLFEGVMNWTLAEVIGTILSQTSVTLQIMQNSIVSAKEDADPVGIDAVFKWFDDLDRILLR